MYPQNVFSRHGSLQVGIPIGNRSAVTVPRCHRVPKSLYLPTISV